MKETTFLQDLSAAQNYMKGGWKETTDATRQRDWEDGYHSLTVYFKELVGFVTATFKNGKMESADYMKLALPGTPGRCATIMAGGLTPYINYSAISE